MIMWNPPSTEEVNQFLGFSGKKTTYRIGHCTYTPDEATKGDTFEELHKAFSSKGWLIIAMELEGDSLNVKCVARNSAPRLPWL